MRRGAKSALIGKWRIIEMGLWDNDYLDMVEPAYIQFKASQTYLKFAGHASGASLLIG